MHPPPISPSGPRSSRFLVALDDAHPHEQRAEGRMKVEGVARRLHLGAGERECSRRSASLPLPPSRSSRSSRLWSAHEALAVSTRCQSRAPWRSRWRQCDLGWPSAQQALQDRGAQSSPTSLRACVGARATAGGGEKESLWGELCLTGSSHGGNREQALRIGEDLQVSMHR